MKNYSLTGLGISFRAKAKNALGALAGTTFCVLTAMALIFSAVTASATPPKWTSAVATTSDDNLTSSTTTVYDFANGIGKTDVTSPDNGITVTENTSVKFASNYGNGRNYIKIAPVSGTFKTNDKITIQGKSNMGNAQLCLYAKSGETTTLMYTTSALGTSETTLSYTITSDCDSIRIGRAKGSSVTLTGITVTRTSSSDKTQLTASFGETSGTYLTTAKSANLPTLTVKADGQTLESSAYNVTYASDDENVFTIKDSEIHFVKAGTATLTATVTPTDENASNYEGCTATYQVTVKEPSVLTITVANVTMNSVDAEVKQPTIKVYGDDDKLLTLGTDYTLSYSVKAGSETAIVSVTDGIFSVTGSPYAWTLGSDEITVTATPTDNNTYKAGAATFTYTVFKGKIKPMFLSTYTGVTLPIKKYDKKTNNNTKPLLIPIIYDGEDISQSFKYTFSITDNSGNDASKKISLKTVKDLVNKVIITAKTEGTYTLKISATPSEDYTDVYDSPSDLSFTIKVSNDYIRPNVSVYPTSTSMTVGQKVAGAELTVTTTTDGTTEPLDDDKYTVTWLSFTPAIVKVNSEDGSLEGLSEGTGYVYVVVKGTEGNSIETMMAELKVYVDDPAMYRAKDKDSEGNSVVYGNQALMQNQNKDISVMLGGWQFPKDVTTSGTTTEGLQASYKWTDNAANAKWSFGNFDKVVMSDDSKNARQENGSNAMPQSTKIYNATFGDQGDIRDAMFNVPCSGSFLVFNPATNGTVTVHVFQNGVFDKKGTDYQYRPQRRVFIMDEAGNFVSSSATIENANSKQANFNYTLSDYTWDLANSSSVDIATVRSHFKGMTEDFDMTSDAFQNNVYESNLSADIVPNSFARDDVKGSHGWCVLSDAPVTYTFKVKAGKSYYLYNYGSKIGFYGYSFEADDVEVDEIEYKSDGTTTNTVIATAEGHVAKVTVPRSFKKGVWNTCVLPFSLNKEQVDAIFGTTYGYNTNGENRSANEDGTQILYFDRVENGKVYFVRHAYNTIVAGKPFLIKTAKDVESINTASVEDYPYVTIENTEPKAWCVGTDYSWVSSYNSMTVKAGDGFISGKDGLFKNYTGEDGTLNAFRGYLKKNESSVPKTLSVNVSSNVEDDGNTTFIDNLQMDSDGNIFAPVSNGKVYTIDGKLVAGDSKNLNALPSGVYIVNGKKYVK